jgi:hypothetical protein
MATLDKIIDSISKVDPVEVIFDVLKRDQQTIIKLNQDQLLEGKLNSGKSTGEYSFGSMSKPYVMEKIARGRIDRSILPHVNLFNEGHFYRGFKVIFGRWFFSLYSTDSKSMELQEKYTTEIFGLEPESVDELVRLKKESFQKNYKQKTGL